MTLGRLIDAFLLWAVITIVWSGRPPPARCRALARPSSVIPHRETRPLLAGRAFVGLGRRALRLLRIEDDSPSPRGDAAAGVAVIGLACLALVEPVLAFLAAAACLAGSVGVTRRRRERARAAVIDALPESVDLVALGIGAGLNLTQCLTLVVPLLPSSVRAAFEGATAEVAAGERVADAVERIPDTLGSVARPFTAALADGERYGTPVIPSLARVADDLRDLRRRRAQEAARRVPVRMLFPLVTCTLPAFALITVVPLIAGSLGTLSH